MGGRGFVGGGVGFGFGTGCGFGVGWGFGGGPLGAAGLGVGGGCGAGLGLGWGYGAAFGSKYIVIDPEFAESKSDRRPQWLRHLHNTVAGLKFAQERQ